jgi:hypothetical protein
MVPNFLIIGTPRSGTTTMYEGLQQHPRVFLCTPKEPMFFILEGHRDVFPGPLNPVGPRDWDSYRRLFEGAGREQAVGEASTFYLYSPDAPSRIKRSLPEIRMIAIFRNPVDRAYSHFLTNRLAGTEPLSDFEKAMDAEERRLRKGWYLYWCYRGMGFYGAQLERYISFFPPEQFRFFLFEDLVADPGALFRGIFDFLEVDIKVHIRLPEKYNPSGVPRSGFVHRFLTRPNFIKSQLKRILPEKTQYNLLTRFMNRNLAKPRLPPRVRRRLIEVYREDILKTQTLIQRDLSSWLVANNPENGS